MPGAAGQLKALYNQTLAGEAPGATGNVAGDLSEQLQAIIDQLLLTTDMQAFTGSATGSLGERLQYIVDRLIGTTDLGAATGSATGSLPEQLAYLIERLISTTDLGAATGSATGSLPEQLAYLIERLIGTTDMGAFTGSETGSLGEKLQDIKDNLGGGVSKTDPPGYFLIPAGPAAGTSVTPGSGAYGSYTQMIDPTAAALYIVGVVLRSGATRDYVQGMIGVGAAAAEVAQAEFKFPRTGSNGELFTSLMFPIPIPVAAGARIAVKLGSTAVGAVNTTLMCIAQVDVV